MKKIIITTICILLVSGMAAQISIVGTATPAAAWAVDFYMTQNATDLDLWETSIQLSTGEVKFRQDSSWDVNWGGPTFPSGTGYHDGPNIIVDEAGYYYVTLNTSTGAYNFEVVLSGLSGISHQAVIRNADNELVANQNIGVRVSIIRFVTTGPVVYSETHTPLSNANGLISFVIGQGTVADGVFDGIPWASGPYFLKTEVDPAGGAAYSIEGVTQLLSVPYALHAGSTSDNHWQQSGNNIFYMKSGNVGIGYTTPTSRLSVLGSGSSPTIPSPTSNGILRLGICQNAGLNIGKIDTEPYSTWFQAGWNGTTTDPISLQTLGGTTGIGTLFPETKLHVRGDDSLRVIFSSADGANSLSSGILMRSTFGGDVPDYMPRNLALIKAHFDGGGWGTASLAFHVAGDDCLTDGETDPCERMRITDSGNVGIGTSSPTAQLHTTGSVRFEGAGTPGTGKILTSDANGVATWEEPAVTLDDLLSIIQTLQNGVTDIDGNHYNVVLIGNQLWMKENLKTTKYRDGTNIDYPGSDTDSWTNNTTGAYAWYANDIAWKDSYGALYNWYAVNNPKELCPAGWHVPTDEEWNKMILYLDSDANPMAWGDQSNISGGKLKSTRTSPTDHPRWESPNTSANNASNWSGLPGGDRLSNGTYTAYGFIGHWWSSSEYNSNNVWYRRLNHDNSSVSRYYNVKSNGFSVRCIQGEGS